jgi:hypothetical protein
MHEIGKASAARAAAMMVMAKREIPMCRSLQHNSEHAHQRFSNETDDIRVQ